VDNPAAFNSGESNYDSWIALSRYVKRIVNKSVKKVPEVFAQVVCRWETSIAKCFVVSLYILRHGRRVYTYKTEFVCY